MLGSGPVRLMALMAVSCMAGVTDSVMSPYLCPEVRAKTGSQQAGLCGLMISARFGTHILLILVWAGLMARLGARLILVTSVMVCGLANMALASVVLVSNTQTFTILTFVLLIVSMIGDSGVFSSVYVLAGQTVLTSSPKTDSNTRMRMSGPAWIETLYGVGSMLGPPVGGLIYVKLGFGGVIFVAGVFMVVVSTINWVILFRAQAGPDQSGPEDPSISDEQAESLCDDDHYDTEVEVSGEDGSASVKDLSYCDILSNPVILSCCLLQVSSGMMSSWHLSSLQSHLADTMTLSTGHIGLVYMSQSLVYTCLCPLIGFLLDRHQHRLPFLIIGVLANILGYSLLGPSSLLTRVQPHVALTVTGLMLIGVGQATCLITCLTLMLASIKDSAKESNAAKVNSYNDNDNEISNDYYQVTSVWECCEMVGGYLGSSLGGLAVDNIGFREASNIVVGMEVVIITLLIPFSVLLSQRFQR